MTYIHTTPWAVYNEFDEYAADWLENLIAARLIANGIVDRRSIVDVRPDDYRGFRQVHLFAGIGVWSYAFRRAGVSDDTALWSLSCPCQPFSAAGKGAGVDDERHLWPHAHHLIKEHRPAKIYGEQVASKDGLAWLDLVQTDMEGTDYAFGAVDTCSASVGAPHIRQRLRFHAYDLRSSAGGVADLSEFGRFGRWASEKGVESSTIERSERFRDVGSLGNASSERSLSGTQRGIRRGQEGTGSRDGELERSGSVKWMADCDSHEQRQGGNAGNAQGEGVRAQSGGRSQPVWMDNNDDEGLEGLGSGHQASIRHGQGSLRPASETSEFGGLADADDRQLQVSRRGSQGRNGSATTDAEFVGTGPTNGFWRDADWLFCRDGKWRPVRSSAQQMVDGSTRSMGPLRPEDIRKVEEAVEQWSQRHETDATEAVRNLWDIISEEEVRLRPDGGFDSVREAPFLLAFLRQLSTQGWKFPIGDERSSSEASRTVLRVLRFTEQPSYTSRGRGLDEQQSGEPANPLRFLSQILAYHTEVCWRDTGWQDVGSFPLAHNAQGRVGRLRAYGNAVDAEATREFIEAALEHETFDLEAAATLFEDVLG